MAVGLSPLLPSLARQSVTAAEHVFDVVNTPATVAVPSQIASITSARSAYFTPASTVAKRTPFTTGRSGNPPFGASGDTGSPCAKSVLQKLEIIEEGRINLFGRGTSDLGAGD